tara:strand:+ start:337 stop:540 length:204 start_codon:yes stop_codon:yes gene_type:complete
MTAVILVCWLATAGNHLECERNAFYWDHYWPVDFREECLDWIFNRQIEIVGDGGFLSHAICVPGDVA